MDDDKHRLRFPFQRLSPLNRPVKLGSPQAESAPFVHDPYRVAGNPVSTLPESAIANCFPGLEMDHRNMDRRFFPGLVFEFLDSGGARLISVETSDPDLKGDLVKQISSFADEFKTDDGWFLASVALGSNDPIAMVGTDGTPLGGLTVWRLIRSLGENHIRIAIRTPGEGAREKKFEGDRRIYVNQGGQLHPVFKPGEMQQSLCSPWQHDFRDCSCLYWASNHPDIALGPSPATREDLEQSPDPQAADPMIMWQRRDRDPDAFTLPFREQADDRPHEIDHYELNHRWQELNFVLEGREVPLVYVPDDAKLANPYDTLSELDDSLKAAAQIELALAIEYLFAMYSLNDKIANDEIRGDIAFAKHELLAIAVSEMRHLRWANQIRLELRHAGMLEEPYEPVLSAAVKVPCGTKSKNTSCVNGRRPIEMRPISVATLQDFIDAERPSGTLHGLYARIYATLLSYKSMPFMTELAGRIVADGVRHYSRFSEIRAILSRYLRKAGSSDDMGITRDVILREPDDAIYAEVRRLCDALKSALKRGYSTGDMEDASAIARARLTMHDLDLECNRLADLDESIGVPFDKLFK